MMTVLTGIAIFTALAPATVMAAAPTVIWLEGVASDTDPGLGSWMILLAADLTALLGLLAYLMVWGWPLAIIFLAVRALRALRRRFPRARRANADKGRDRPDRMSQDTKRLNAR
ncbi:hypothetical protein [Microbacterium sp. p3-SID336]|uniref:hypothetical protein n=1 Tax=Microbacterium sp. p3-SID336 TaxID=2916212 RepID=UPI0021A2FF37|nr:hypothetical protein [Microbacterium sp. p3-SID336]MCT1478486.1 hypothetical protein [Microbacterium sp. p3-SID336]